MIEEVSVVPLGQGKTVADVALVTEWARGWLAAQEGPPVVEAARSKATKRVAVGTRSAEKAKRSRVGDPAPQEDEDDEEDDDYDEGDDSRSGGGDGDGDGDGETGGGGGRTWQIVGDLDQGQYVALSPQRHHMVWLHEYARDNSKGVDRTWTLGPLKFKSRNRIIQWEGAYREMVGGRFFLSDFVQELSAFAQNRAGITVTPALPDGALEGQQCPFGQNMSSHRIQLRGMLQSEMSVEGPLQSVMAVIVHSREAPSLVMYRLWNCWSRNVGAIHALMQAWDASHPNATIRAVEALVMQIRLPEADHTLTEAAVQARADNMDLTPVAVQQVAPPGPF
jgi:hypothetical protein